MTESEWLTSKDGMAMLHLVQGRISRRKYTFAYGGDPDASTFYEQWRNGELYERRSVIADALREQLGNPFRPYMFDSAWRTETVVAFASGIEVERAFDRMPILADALEETGCDERAMLDHLRGPGPHARGCWALDLILDREPELFARPPLVPPPNPAPQRKQPDPSSPPRPG